MSIGAIPSRGADRGRLAALAAQIANPTDRVVLAALFALVFSRQCGKELALLFTGAAPLSTFRAAEFIGFAAIGASLRSLGGACVLGRWDLAGVGVAAAALVIPSDSIGALALTFLGCLFCARRSKPLASIGRLSLGLAWVAFWGALAMGVVAPWLLPLETRLGFWVGSLFAPVAQIGNAIMAENGHRVIVASECSSFANTVRASLIWLSFLTIQGLEMRWRHVRVLALGACGIVALNTLRLALMAQSRSAYLFWHEGSGASLVAAVGLTFLLSLFYTGLKAGRREER